MQVREHLGSLAAGTATGRGVIPSDAPGNCVLNAVLRLRVDPHCSRPPASVRNYTGCNSTGRPSLGLAMGTSW